MADETKKPAATPTVAELVTKLKTLGNAWCEKQSGKPNCNPHLRIKELITPLLGKLSAKDAQVTPQLLDAVNKLPAEPAVLDSNWQPPVKESGLPRATPELVGEKNAR